MNWINYFVGKTPFPLDFWGLNFTIYPRSIDPATFFEVFIQKQYLPDGLNEASTVVDVGANIGFFSLWAIKVLHAKKIIAVEMDFNNFELLQKNLANNFPKTETILINKAFYKKPGTVGESDHTSPTLNTCYRLNEKSGGNIKTITFNELVLLSKNKPIDLLKMDIEGSEKYLFSNENRKLIKNHVRYVAIETHPHLKGSTTNEMLKFLNEAGFSTKTKSYPNLFSNTLYLDVITGKNKNF
jgi:FkbM family methyltransferase